ncbi:hypothetical protein SAMN04488065_1065 [Haloplanus vescus]|uniref:Uncharacterized protein n=1 Tax=Haloplanus vescus TaxID=555874 RepID=A0A1H3WQN8_9EURY|nr:hypothetical protein SAMN04488065_1065 [Haloplanus vescus]
MSFWAHIPFVDFNYLKRYRDQLWLVIPWKAERENNLRNGRGINVPTLG